MVYGIMDLRVQKLTQQYVLNVYNARYYARRWVYIEK